MVEAQQRRSRRGRDELEHFPPVHIGEGLHGLPEQPHTGMFQPVVADRINTAILRILPQIREVDLGAVAPYKCLQFILVEHGKPGLADNPAKPLQEGVCLLPRLDLQAVARKILDVDEAVCVCDGGLGAVWAEVVGYRF